MAELSTIARPYAEALFAVARLGDAASVQRELLVLSSVAAQSDMQSWVKNPAVGVQQILDLFKTIATQLNQAPLSSTVANLLDAVVRNKRVAILPEIASQFTVLKDTAAGASEVRIVSAFPLTAEQLQDLTTALQKKFGLHLKPTVVIDTHLIGGVRVQVGDQVLDTSVQAQLESMRLALMAA